MTNEPQRTYEQKRLAWESAIKRLDFEINLLWQRGLYFWTFIAATFVAYFSVPASSDFEKTLIAIFGFLISIAWWLANVGSKYWQAVWEVKVKELEVDVTGNLYGWIPNMDNKSEFLRGRRFSVSRIAIAVSAIVAFFWFGIVLRQSFGWSIEIVFSNPWVVVGLTLIAGVILAWLTYSDQDSQQ